MLNKNRINKKGAAILSVLAFLVAGLVACDGDKMTAERPVPANTFASINLIPAQGKPAPELVVLGPHGKIPGQDKKPTTPATSKWTVEFHKGSCDVYICGPAGCYWYHISDGDCPPGF